MADPVESMTHPLLQPGFTASAPVTDVLGDPAADTPMLLTLDQLRPYDLNPRVTRNPLYDDIKSSIRERGLDAPPAVTRRPGTATYMIRNGGNTRLAILRELWSETRQERYYRITCLFRPWSQRGEIVALTGHLAENELHGELTFIERAVAVAKARELYVQETGKAPSQAELARLLSGDGYPISQSQISRMEDTLEYLLPAIPTLLYGGLGRRSIVQLITLRRAAARVFDKHAANHLSAGDFLAVYQEVLGRFDGDPDTFVLEPVQDELVAQLAEVLGVDYDLLNLDIHDMVSRHPLLSQTLASDAPLPVQAAARAPASPVDPRSAPVAKPARPQPTATTTAAPLPVMTEAPPVVASSSVPTPRLQQLRQMLADHGAPSPADTTLSIPIQVEGLYPVTDLWRIEPSLDEPSRLRIHIAQLATELTAHDAPHVIIESVVDGIGYRGVMASRGHVPTARGHALAALLNALRDAYAREPTSDAAPDVAAWLVGTSLTRLADEALLKVFRLVRLARRLDDLESAKRDEWLGEDA